MALFGKKKQDESQDKQVEATVKSESEKKVAVPEILTPFVLTSPRLSEKSSRLATANKYVFNVAKNANKVEIKKAVERSYKVRVTRVNVSKVKSKQRNFGRISGKTSGFKKATVSLKAGDKIAGLSEGV